MITPHEYDDPVNLTVARVFARHAIKKRQKLHSIPTQRKEDFPYLLSEGQAAELLGVPRNMLTNSENCETI